MVANNGIGLRKLCALLLAVLFVVCCGCSSDAGGAAQQESNLKKLSLFFGQYQGLHQGAWAADEKSLKEFINSRELMLKSQGISDVDGLFISERDHQPYVILYGSHAGVTDGPGGAPVVAYEKQGVGGKRFVASSLGAVEEVDDQRLRQWVPNLR